MQDPKPSLSIVIPVYNEPKWLPVAAADAVRAQSASPFETAELIIVDDGSDEATRDAIGALALDIPTKVIRHPENRGRAAARRTGVDAASFDYVLFVDSRVSIQEGSLAFVGERILDPDQQVWNAHVTIDDAHNPYARFWQIIAELAWPDYFSGDDRVQYGPDDYDRYPKGTTCFFAPRKGLLEAMGQASSHYNESRRGNDELFLRSLVQQHRFNIAPEFACLYRARGSFAGFLRHTHHRGQVFVDGFLRPGVRFFPALVAFFPASALVVAAAVRYPAKAGRLLIASPLLAALGGVAKRRSGRDIRVLASLGPPWLLAFSTGLWRGVVLVLRSRTGK